MSKRRPYTLEEHQQVGADLAAMRNRLQKIGIDIANRYGKTKRVGRTALRMLEALDSVRCQMDSEACRDLGAKFNTRLYYPGEDLPTSPTVHYAEEPFLAFCGADVANQRTTTHPDHVTCLECQRRLTDKP